jgi:hypothetical protein
MAQSAPALGLGSQRLRGASSRSCGSVSNKTRCRPPSCIRAQLTPFRRPERRPSLHSPACRRTSPAPREGSRRSRSRHRRTLRRSPRQTQRQTGVDPVTWDRQGGKPWSKPRFRVWHRPPRRRLIHPLTEIGRILAWVTRFWMVGGAGCTSWQELGADRAEHFPYLHHDSQHLQRLRTD